MSALPPLSSAPGTALPALSAPQRLARSRQHMMGWLADDSVQRAATCPGAGMAHWVERLREHPLAAIALDALGRRWSRHPWLAAWQVGEVAARETLAPLVRRHPVVVLGLAAVAGALLVRARPWRWLLRPALLAGLATQLASRLLAPVAPPPAQPTVRQPTDNPSRDS